MIDLRVLKEYPDILKQMTVQVSGDELLDFVKSIIPKQPEVYITPEQLCEKIQVSLQTLINWDDAGILKPIKFGRLKRYLLSDIEKIGTDQYGTNR